MKSAYNAFLLAGAMFLGLGIIFMGVSLGFFKSNERLMETGVSAPGVYSKVGSKSVWFTFEAEGRVWEKKSNISSFAMREGDEVTVWYPAGRPDQARITTWETWGMFLIVGGIFSLMGAGFLIPYLAVRLRRRSLMENGTRVQAKVKEITQNHWVRVNSVNPYTIHAVCIHPFTGQEMKVKSEPLMEDPRAFLSGGEIEVLVDPMNEKRYYMPVERAE